MHLGGGEQGGEKTDYCRHFGKTDGQCTGLGQAGPVGGSQQ